MLNQTPKSNKDHASLTSENSSISSKLIRRQIPPVENPQLIAKRASEKEEALENLFSFLHVSKRFKR
jgi:hypothetical protein